MIPTLMGKCQIYYLMTENITNLHHLHLLAAVVFSCFKVPKKVHGLELLKNYFSIFKNSPAKHTTFKLMIWWTTRRKKYRFFFLNSVDIVWWKIQKISPWLLRFRRIWESILSDFSCKRIFHCMTRDLLEYKSFLD